MSIVQCVSFASGVQIRINAPLKILVILVSSENQTKSWQTRSFSFAAPRILN